MTEPTITGRLYGSAYHRVPAETVLKNLQHDLRSHIGADWWAMVLLPDGRWLSRGARTSSTAPSSTTMELLRRMAVVLNLQVAEDGHWVVALRPAENEVWALWRDGDGDPHVVIEYDAKVQALHSWIDDHIAGQAHAALNVWRLQNAKVEARPDQMIRRTLGEAPTRH